MAIRSNGDSTSKERIAYGTTTITAGVGTVASPYISDIVVTFSPAFPTIPAVFVSLASAETTAGYNLAAINVTSSQFTLRFVNTTGSSAGCDVNWFAIQGPKYNTRVG